jgi:ABC-type lipoprotein release transport system permease subunit
MIPGTVLVYYLQVHPINYESIGDAVNMFGGDALIGTALTLRGIIFVFLEGVLVSIVASLYPAILAIKKRPVEIMRSV